MLVTFLFVGVMPTRTYFQQQTELATTHRRVDVLSDQNRALEKRVAELQTDEEIERLAREQYNLVKPGEDAYAILPAPEEPPPSTTTTSPRARAAAEAAADDGHRDRGWWAKLVDAVLP